MGKAIGGLPETPALTPQADPGAHHIGAWLARQRRLRGISLDELESLTRIPRRSLERLEAGAHDATPDGFARGFVRTVASAIGLDPDDAVARMLSEHVPTPVRRRARLFPLLALCGSLLALAGLLTLAASVLERRPGRLLARSAAAPDELHRHDYVRQLVSDVASGRFVPRPPPLAPADLQPAGTPEVSDAASPEQAALALEAPAPAPAPAPAEASTSAPSTGAEPLGSGDGVAPH